ncbi:hypothetical protein BGZ65_012437, partial [Modicella reniformis]
LVAAFLVLMRLRLRSQRLASTELVVVFPALVNMEPVVVFLVPEKLRQKSPLPQNPRPLRASPS